MDFLEVKRLITNKQGTQIIVPETIKIADIKTFRPWHKAPKDKFEGEATLVILYTKSKVTGVEASDEDDDKTPTMLVSESYKNFLNRLSGRVIIIGEAVKNIPHQS